MQFRIDVTVTQGPNEDWWWSVVVDGASRKYGNEPTAEAAWLKARARVDFLVMRTGRTLAPAPQK